MGCGITFLYVAFHYSILDLASLRITTRANIANVARDNYTRCSVEACASLICHFLQYKLNHLHATCLIENVGSELTSIQSFMRTQAKL